MLSSRSGPIRSYPDTVRTGTTGDPEVLSHGDPPPRTPARATIVAAALVLAGAAVGVGAQRTFGPSPTPAAAHGAEHVIAGALYASSKAASPAGYSVPLYNPGSRSLTVLDVDPVGWKAHNKPVDIPPRQWAEVPLGVDMSCDSTPDVTSKLRVRLDLGNGRVEQVVPLSTRADILVEEHRRRCDAPIGRVPSRRELLGTWLVDEGRDAAGTMVFRLDADGSFAMDYERSMLDDDPVSYGSFTYDHGLVVLSTQGGRGCASGDENSWDATLLRDGRLHLRFGSQLGNYCRVDDGEVWVARKVAGP